MLIYEKANSSEWNNMFLSPYSKVFYQQALHSIFCFFKENLSLTS